VTDLVAFLGARLDEDWARWRVRQLAVHGPAWWTWTVTDPDPAGYAEQIARRSHALYNRFAEMSGWSTQESTRVDWDDLPEANRATMVATFRGLLEAGVIEAGPAVTGRIEESAP